MTKKRKLNLAKIQERKIDLVNMILNCNMQPLLTDDEKINIALGTKYLSTLVKKYNGNYYLAIVAYNAGMGNVDKWLEEGIIDTNLKEYKNVDIPFSQTKDYLYKVINSYKTYRILYE